MSLVSVFGCSRQTSFYNPQKLLFIVNIFVGYGCSNQTSKVIAVGIVVVVAVAVVVDAAIVVVVAVAVVVVDFKVTVKVLPEV